MSSGLILPLTFFVLSAISVGLVLVAPGVKKVVKVLFALSILSIMLWVITVHASNIESSYALIINRLAFLFPLLSLVFFNLFIKAAYTQDRSEHKRKLHSAVLLGFIGSILAMHPGGIKSVNVVENSAKFEGYSIVAGPLYYALVTIFIMSAIFLGVRIISTYRSSSGNTRSSLKIIIAGLAITIPTSIVTNLIGPIIFSDSLAASSLSNLSIIFFVISVTYSIIKYSFLDIRRSAIRLVAYSISIVTLIGAYTLLIWGLILPFVYPDTELSLPSFLVVIGGTVSTIYFYDKIKSFFDFFIDKLFFRNTYNLTQFLDEFNQTLINSSDIGELSKAIARVINNTLKSDFVIIMIKSEDFKMTMDSRGGVKDKKLDSRIPIGMIKYYYSVGSRVVLKDYMDREEYEGLYSQLNSIGAAVAIDLSESSKSTTSLKQAVETGSYKTMILGPKSNGDSYSAQDLDALKIISKELVIGLQNSMRFEEIRLFNLDLQRKVDDATLKLRQQNKKLVLADELKDDFLSIASHQMRTPISSILGYSSILSTGDAGKMNRKQEKFAKTMEDSAKRLSYLINDFLTVSRLKSGKFNIDRVKTDLKQILRGEARNLESQFKAKQIHLKVNIGSKIPTLNADGQKLRQVMMNLIDNAMYYTPQGGEVEVTLIKDGPEIIFEVKDNGIGVPAEDQSMLFTKMYRASNAQRMRPDGTGLGLFLAKRVVSGHKGHVIFRSTEGEGSVFGFRIPIREKRRKRA